MFYGLYNGLTMAKIRKTIEINVVSFLVIINKFQNGTSYPWRKTEFSPSFLRVREKVVFLHCRWPINRVGCKIDPTSILAEITKSKASIF
jgi:hypothetical protein